MRPLDALNAGSPDTYFGFGSGALFAGKAGSSNNRILETGGGSGQVTTNIPARQNATAFLVIRQTFGADTGKIELWINPRSGQPLPAPDATKTHLNIQGIKVGIGGNIRCTYNEYRVVRTGKSVSPVK